MLRDRTGLSRTVKDSAQPNLTANPETVVALVGVVANEGALVPLPIPPIPFYIPPIGRDRTMQVYIMTKNEWPLIKSTVLYHGTVFGFGNLYVIDASTDPVVLSFLDTANKQLGVNVIYSKSDLNTVNTEINMLINREKRYADFLIKVDTDEIIVHYDKTTNKISTDPTIIRDYLKQLPYDGARLKIGYQCFATVFPNCSDSDNTFITARHTSPMGPTTFKTFFASVSFGEIDLGGHIGEVYAPFNNSVLHYTDLSIVHYHYQCFDRIMRVTERAVLSHQYILPTDTLQQKIDKLHNLTWDFPTNCRQASCHKAYDYWLYLTDPIGKKNAYYASKETLEDPHLTQLHTEVSDKMIELENKYAWVV